MFNIDDVLLELSYRVETGIVDLTNPRHIALLKEIIKESDRSDSIDSETIEKGLVIFEYLKEYGKRINEAPAKQKSVSQDAHDKGLEGKGGTAYGPVGKDIVTHVSEKGKLVKLPKPRKAGGKDPSKTEKEPKSSGQKLDPTQFQLPAEKEKKKKRKSTEPIKSEPEEPTSTNPYVKPGERIKDPKKVALLKRKDAEKVKQALNKTKKQEEAERAAAKKAGKEKKGVGAGTASSRAGECAVVTGGQMLTDMINKGEPYEKAIAKVEKYLRGIANKSDSLLTPEWVDSALNTLNYIHKEIGFNNIQHFTWDTPEGRAIVGSEGHGTSSDCFILTKSGKRVGLSLKKDLKVFVFNGGLEKMTTELKEKGMQGLPEITDYKQKLTKQLKGVRSFANNSETKEKFCEDFDHLKKNSKTRFGEKAVGKRETSIKKATGKSLKATSCDDFIKNVINNPSPTGDMVKIIADMCKTSTNNSLRTRYENMRNLDSEMTEEIRQSFTDTKNKPYVNDLVRESTHIDDILFADNKNLDNLKVLYGEKPAVEMKKENLIKILGIEKEYAAWEKEKNPKKKERLKKALDKKINSKITVSGTGGVMSVGINIGRGGIIPIFEAGVRTRGIGSAPNFEMAQNKFGGLAFKNGTTDFTTWSDDDRTEVVNSMSKDLLDDLEDLNLNNPAVIKDILIRIKKLGTILPEKVGSTKSFSALVRSLPPKFIGILLQNLEKDKKNQALVNKITAILKKK